jgi:hypothetical protein
LYKNLASRIELSKLQNIKYLRDKASGIIIDQAGVNADSNGGSDDLNKDIKEEKGSI